MKIKRFNESKYTAEEHINTICTYCDEIKNNINRIQDEDILENIEFDLSNILHQYDLLDEE